MSQKQTITPATPALKLADIYFILFRHKWMILSLTALSFLAASITFSYWQMPYRSVAEIYISSVDTPQAPGQTAADSQRLDLSPVVVLNTEVLILKSLDLASNAADLVGPERILGRDGASTNVTDAARAAVRDEAALAIQKNFEAGAIRDSQIIELVYTHPNRAVVTDVLDKMISTYLKEHSDLHEHLHIYDTLLSQESEQRQHHLKDIEDQLATLKSDGGVVDVEEAKKVFATTEETVRQEESQSKTELALWQAAAEELQKQMPAGNPAATNALKATNATAAAPSRALIAQYTRINQKVQDLQAEAEQLERRGLGSAAAAVLTNQFELAAAQEEKSKMEDANQGLLNVATSVSAPGQGPAANGPNPAADLKKAQVSIAGLMAKIQMDEDELARLKVRGANLNKLGDGIKDLERDEANVEREYQEIYAAKAKADLDEKVKDVGNINIKIIQSPSTPVRDVKTISKVIIGIGASGPILALLLAVVWELVLDRSFKRPQEVMTRLKLPFFISIPNLKAKDMKRQQEFNLPKEAKMLAAGAGDTPAAGAENKALVPSKSGALATWDEKHSLRPFHETLRDRLVSYFEMINLTHKPKLVAVTSCGDGAGVSTVASGLASSLSETGDGNVLLVDMNSENGEAHHFFKGKLAMGLDDILETQKEHRANALVSDNLYAVKESTNGDKLPSILPKRFSHLVTKLKASDYDYIILDMPPVTEVSVTPRLAKFMDMVLLVVEAGKTNQDAAQRAATLLTESRANVGVVMNKCRSYVPRRLLHEA